MGDEERQATSDIFGPDSEDWQELLYRREARDREDEAQDRETERVFGNGFDYMLSNLIATTRGNAENRRTLYKHVLETYSLIEASREHNVIVAELANGQSTVAELANGQMNVDNMAGEGEDMDEIEAEENRRLARLNLAWVREHRLLWCTVCGTGLGRSFDQHIRKAHSCRLKASEERWVRQLCFPPDYTPSPYFERSAELREPLPFLEVVDGFRCGMCAYYSKARRQMKDHHNSRHSESAFGENRCKVQTLSKSRSKTYFGVQDPGVTAPVYGPPTARAAAARELMAHAIAAHTGIEDRRQRSHFFSSMGWFLASDPYASVDQAPYVRTPEQEDLVWDRIRDCFRAELGKVNYHCASYRHAISANPVDIFDGLQEPATMDVYAREFTRLCVFVLRLNQTPIPQKTMSDAIVEAVEEVQRVFSSPDFEPGATANTGALVNLGFEILREPVSPGTSHRLAELFMRFYCLKEGQEIRNVDELEYFFRLVMLLRLMRVQFTPEADRIIAEELQLVKTTCPHGVFTLVCHIHGAAKEEKGDTEALLRLVPGRNYDEVIIDGTMVSLETIRFCLRAALDEYSRLLESMMLGAESRLDLRSFRDKLANRQPGYRFETSTNPHVDANNRFVVMEAILANDAISDAMLARTDGAFSRRAAENYIENYNRLQELLLVIIHLSSGLPARATEMSTYRLVNGETSLRSVFFLDGQLFFMPLYNKTRGLTGRNKPIARFLSPEISRMVLMDLVHIRPLVTAMANFLDLNPDHVYNTELFVFGGVKADADELRKRFAGVFGRITGTRLLFSQYRQVIAYFARRHNIQSSVQGPEGLEGDDEDDDAPDGADMLPRQMGNTNDVNYRHYGRHADEHPRMPQNVLAAFREISGAMYRLMTFQPRPRLHPRLRPVRMVLQDAGEEANALERPVNATERSVDAANRPEDIDDIIADGRLVNADERPFNAVQRPVILQDSSVLFAEPINPETDGIFISSKQSRYALNLLKIAYGDNAEFRSPEQRIAVEYTLFTRQNMIVVLPVGTGKTLLVELLAVREPRKMHVLVVPLISLRENLVQRLAAGGIRASCDESAFPTDLQVLIVTPERLYESRAIGKLISAKAGSSCLGTIFIDEAHAFAIDSTYRPKFRHLSRLLLYSVPVVCLTGTAPSWVVSDLRQNLYCSSDVRIIRQGATVLGRRRYHVHRNLSTDEFIDRVCEVQRALPEVERSIIYVPSRAGTEAIAARLTVQGMPAFAFYARNQAANQQLNRASLESWLSNPRAVLVATSAFGVGVHYENISNIFMWGLPFSAIELIQQAGRAGRNGGDADIHIFFKPGDEQYRLAHMENGLTKQLFSQLFWAISSENVCLTRVLSRYVLDQEESCLESTASMCDACRAADMTPEQILATRQSNAVANARTLGRINAGAILYLDLYEAVMFFQRNCVICFFTGREYRHAKCGNVPSDACCACYQNPPHGAQCRNASLPNLLKDRGLCYLCGLPGTESGLVFHGEGEFAKSDRCPYRRSEVVKVLLNRGGRNSGLLDYERESAFLHVHRELIELVASRQR